VTTIYRLKATKQPRPMDPLHVGNFYRRERTHRESSQDRQDLILWLAALHARASVKGKPRAFNTIKLRLTALRDWVYDYRPALDYFFEVQQLGYSCGEADNEISTLIPRDLEMHTYVQMQQLSLIYEPPPRPLDGVISKVYIQQQNEAVIRKRLERENRFDLYDAVSWLLERNEVNFIFKPAGKLQQRDTSIWPVAAVETWPSWLREELFGPGIDIDSAYTQYLMGHIQEAYRDRPHLVKTLYPDLVKLIEDKHTWRRVLCEKTLGLEWNEDNIALVKKVCMSLANGSRISPAIMVGGSSYSVTAQIVIEAATNMTPTWLERTGRRLQSISRQYSRAKQLVCTSDLHLHPSRRNQKRVFAGYFEWEREARYLIWEAIDRHGVMVHDGIDGVPARYLADLPKLVQQIGVKLTT